VSKTGAVKATVEAVFQDGVFKPVRRPDLLEGERVRITVETVAQAKPDDILLGMADSLIAGIVMEHSGRLLTRNRRHFERVEGLCVLPAQPRR
jgi:predicted DNA-binding antitoxin AbrB/MazE fold protein